MIDNPLVVGSIPTVGLLYKAGGQESFVCKEEYARGFIDFFDGMERFEIICAGMEQIKNTHFVDKLESIAKEYFDQKAKRRVCHEK